MDNLQHGEPGLLPQGESTSRQRNGRRPRHRIVSGPCRKAARKRARTQDHNLDTYFILAAQFREIYFRLGLRVARKALAKELEAFGERIDFGLNFTSQTEILNCFQYLCKHTDGLDRPYVTRLIAVTADGGKTYQIALTEGIAQPK